MKARTLFALLALCAAVTCSIPTQADAPTVVYGPTRFSSGGSLPVINLSGQGVCEFGFNGLGTVTPMGSSNNGSTYFAITSTGFGAQTNQGEYGGPLLSVGNTPVITNFYLAVSVSSGNLTAWESCGTTVSSISPPTPIPYTSASPLPVVFPTPFALSYTTASPLPVTCISGCSAGGGSTPIPTLPPELSTTSPLPVASSLPVIGQLYFWNGTGWIAVTSTSPLPVTTPAPVGTIGVVNQAACAAAYPCGMPTPIPFPSAFFVTGAFPTPIPFPTLGVVQIAAPSATTPVSCAAATNCPVNASQVTSPWVVSTPSSAPAPTASAGAAIPSNAVQVFAQILCQYTGGTVSITAGNTYTARCDQLGNQIVTFPSAQPVTIASAVALTVNTPAPVATVFIVNTPAVNQGTSPWVVSTINPSLPAPQVTWPVSTINPSLPAPQVTWPVTTPAPVGTIGVVQQAAPLATTPVSTPSSAPMPTNGCSISCTGYSPPPLMPNVSAYSNCIYYLAGTTLNSGNASFLRCNSQGSLVTSVQGAVYTANNSNGIIAFEACDQQKAVNISTATTTQIIPVSGSTSVYICAYHLYVVSGTLPSFMFEYGTSTNCTGTTAMSGTFGGIAGAIGESFEAGGGLGAILRTTPSQGVCIVSAGTTPNIQGWVSYDQH